MFATQTLIFESLPRQRGNMRLQEGTRVRMLRATILLRKRHAKQAMQDKLRLLIKERTDANECTPRAGEQAERGMLVDVGSAVPTPR